jgi:transcriptional regulator with XRE-family HTH domain
MPIINDHLQQFISDPKRRRIYEREALAFDASELVSHLMEQQGVNKTDLAALIGTSKSHVTNLLSGSRNMTMHTLADLTFALGHKVKIEAAPLSAVACWMDSDEKCTETYAGGWGIIRSKAYKSEHSHQSQPPRGGQALEECEFAVA